MKVEVKQTMKKVIKANKSLGSDISDYQKWVDFDMKKYGKISDTTMKDIKEAGLSVVKDQYGDYEVIADDKVEGGCHGKRKVTASIDKYALNDEIWGLLHNIKDMKKKIDGLFDLGVADSYIREVLNRVYADLSNAYADLNDVAD